MKISFAKHAKALTLAVTLSSIVAPSLAFSAPSRQKEESREQEERQEAAYKSIDAKTLKSWIDAKKEMALIDARPKKFEKGEVIIGARFLPYDAEEAVIAKALPSKDTVIVTYCASEKCPASTYLSEQLVAMGYTHVYKYPGGIDDWQDHNYPTGKAKVY